MKQVDQRSLNARCKGQVVSQQKVEHEKGPTRPPLEHEQQNRLNWWHQFTNVNNHLPHVTFSYFHVNTLSRAVSSLRSFSTWGLHVSHLPQLQFTDMHKAFKQMVVSSDTFVKPSFLTVCKSPLEGPSAILLKELTLEIQHMVRTWVSISANKLEITSTTWLSDFPRIKLNLVPSFCQSRGSSFCWPLLLTTDCKQERHRELQFRKLLFVFCIVHPRSNAALRPIAKKRKDSNQNVYRIKPRPDHKLCHVIPAHNTHRHWWQQNVGAQWLPVWARQISRDSQRASRRLFHVQAAWIFSCKQNLLKHQYISCLSGRKFAIQQTACDHVAFGFRLEWQSLVR